MMQISRAYFTWYVHKLLYELYLVKHTAALGFLAALWGRMYSKEKKNGVADGQVTVELSVSGLE